MTVRVGIDVGGTFTDLALFDEDAGTWSIARKGKTATLELTPFVRIARKDRAALELEAEALLAFAEPEAGSRSLSFEK